MATSSATTNVEYLRERAQTFMEEISCETYLAYSGQKSDAELQAIYERYASILNEETLQACVARFQTAPANSEEQRAARLMVEWQAESSAGRQLAELDEREIKLENETVLTLPDSRTIPYQSAAIEIMNTADRGQRNAIDRVRAHAARDYFAPLRQEHLQREKDYIESLGIAPTYNATFEALSGVSLEGLAGECRAFLRDTEAMWTDVVRERLKAFGVPPAEATRADALALFRLKEYDDAFPAETMESTIRLNCMEMGIDASANGRIRFDLDDRPSKRSRAFCSPVRVPQEVYLVLRPHGGQSDYNTFLHELGHALHFGYAREDYPFEYRWLGDNSVTESYAMLFDHRMQDRGWLRRYTSLGSRTPAFLRLAGFEELHFLRRYSAKLIYEVQVYGGAVRWESLPDLYVQTLSEATGFQYDLADAFIDLDPRYYSTRYLRAWQLQAILNASLTERFNEDWWRNPSAGPWLVHELFGEGQRENASEVAARVGPAGQHTLSFAPLVRSIESLLTA